MNEQNAVQELKAERVQGPESLSRNRHLARTDDAVGSAMAVTRSQAEQRLKAERVQTRLKRMKGWKMQSNGQAIDRMRRFSDPLVAHSYLAFASLLARQWNQPLRASVVGGEIVIALIGRTKGSDKGITDEVLDLAEQLG